MPNPSRAWLLKNGVDAATLARALGKHRDPLDVAHAVTKGLWRVQTEARTLLPEGPPGTWTVEVPGFALRSLNRARNKHWSVEYGLKTETARVVGKCLLAAGVTRAKGKRRISIHVDRTDGKHADLENLLKIANDPLKWLGVIVDDGPEWLEFGRYTTGKGPRRSVFIIEDF